jgi:hypothetical protein
LTFRKHHHTLTASLVFINAAIMGFPSAINTKHYQPGLKEGNVRSPKHPSNQTYTFKAHDPTRLPFPASNDDNPTNNNPSVHPAPHNNNNNNNGSVPENTPPGPNDTDDAGMSTLDKILTPPESDTDPQSKNQDVKVFRSQWQPHIRVCPFSPQPPNTFKQRKRALNRRRNPTNKGRKTPPLLAPGLHGALQSMLDDSDGDDTENDGDDGDDDGADADDPVTPISVRSETATHLDPPITPRRVTRSQVIDLDSDYPTPSPRAFVPQPKRKRDDSKTDPATPTQGQRVSKRQRNSPTNSPLPPMQIVKRTRAEQKKFESKFNDLIFDPERPGSVEGEVVEIKSGAQEWKRASLHDEPWDGNRESE